MAKEPEPVGKKMRSWSRRKKNEEPEPKKNLPAPQPWEEHYIIISYDTKINAKPCLALYPSLLALSGRVERGQRCTRFSWRYCQHLN